MGNTESAVVQQRLARFRPDERPVIEGVFERLQSGAANLGKTAGPPPPPGKTLTLEALQTCMSPVVPDSMTRRIYRSMCSIDPGPSGPAAPGRSASCGGPGPGVGRDQLLVFMADVLRGTAEERAPLLLSMARHGAEAAVTCQQVTEFLQDLVSAVVQVQVSGGRLQGWRPERMGDARVGAELLAEQLSSELKPAEDGSCSVSVLEDWLFRVSQVSLYLELLVSEGLNVRVSGRPACALLPPCWVAPWAQLRSLLDLPTLMFLAPQLPDGAGAPWRLLFSTQLHGESFTRLVSGLTGGGGATLLLVRDSANHLFGGFASNAWQVKPQFQGDSRCFLFSVSPSLRVHTATGYNQHFMYLNQNQQTMPNGLGMGGQLGYFGLWLDSDFGRGHSRAVPRCTTFGSPQLSADQDFVVDHLEVWAVGKPPEPEEDQDQDGQKKRSVLDLDPEVQAMMEMTGKTLHSQGLREPEEDQDQ